MEPDKNMFKWVAAAVVVILICFSLGYFVLGPTARTTPAPVQVAETTPDATPSVAATPAAPAGGGLIVDEKTDEIEAKRAKAEADAKAKADAEAKKQAEEKAAADAAAAAAAASPSPDASPSPEAGAAPDANATPNPAAPDTTGAGTAATPAPQQPAPAAPTPDALYRVRVGSFTSRDAARSQAAEMNGRGYSTTIVSEKTGSGTVYHLQVGAYRDPSAADGIQKELRANGYDSTILH